METGRDKHYLNSRNAIDMMIGRNLNIRRELIHNRIQLLILESQAKDVELKRLDTFTREYPLE